MVDVKTDDIICPFTGLGCQHTDVSCEACSLRETLEKDAAWKDGLVKRKDGVTDGDGADGVTVRPFAKFVRRKDGRGIEIGVKGTF